MKSQNILLTTLLLQRFCFGHLSPAGDNDDDNNQILWCRTDYCQWATLINSSPFCYNENTGDMQKGQMGPDNDINYEGWISQPPICTFHQSDLLMWCPNKYCAMHTLCSNDDSTNGPPSHFRICYHSETGEFEDGIWSQHDVTSLTSELKPVWCPNNSSLNSANLCPERELRPFRKRRQDRGCNCDCKNCPKSDCPNKEGCPNPDCPNQGEGQGKSDCDGCQLRKGRGGGKGKQRGGGKGRKYRGGGGS